MPKKAHAASGSDDKKAAEPATITLHGVDHASGDTLTFKGQSVILETQKKLAASPRSGVSAGTYIVVSTILQPSGRKAFRAIVGDELYPIRSYGEKDETISKIRGKYAARSKARRRGEEAPSHEAADIALTASADKILSEYLAHKKNLDGGDVLSDLIEKYLRPELAKIRASEDAIRRLPNELLSRLASVDEDTRRRVREMLG